MKIRTTITFETWRTTVIRRRDPVVVWCNTCGRETEMYSTSETASVNELKTLVHQREIRSEDLHYIESASGALFICRHSLIKTIPGDKI